MDNITKQNIGENVWNINTKFNWAEDVDKAEEQGELEVPAPYYQKLNNTQLEQQFPSLEISKGRKSGKKKSKAQAVSLQQFNANSGEVGSSVLRMSLPQFSRSREGEGEEYRSVFLEGGSRFRKDSDGEERRRDNRGSFGSRTSVRMDQCDSWSRSPNLRDTYDSSFFGRQDVRNAGFSRGRAREDRFVGKTNHYSRADTDEHWQQHDYRTSGGGRKLENYSPFGERRVPIREEVSNGYYKSTYYPPRLKPPNQPPNYARSQSALNQPYHASPRYATTTVDHPCSANHHQNYNTSGHSHDGVSCTSPTPNNSHILSTQSSEHSEHMSDSHSINNFSSPRKKVDPFAGARPREEVLKTRQQSSRMVSDEKHQNHSLNKSVLSPLLESLPSEEKEDSSKFDQRSSDSQQSSQNLQTEEASICQESVKDINFQAKNNNNSIEIQLYNQGANCSQDKVIQDGFSNPCRGQSPICRKHQDPFGGAKPREEVLKARQQQALSKNVSLEGDKESNTKSFVPREHIQPQQDEYVREIKQGYVKQREESRRIREDPFAGARPREEVLKSRHSSLSAASIQSAQDSNQDIGSFMSNSTLEEWRSSRKEIRSQLLV